MSFMNALPQSTSQTLINSSYSNKTMQTESPTTNEQTIAILTRINRQIEAFLDNTQPIISRKGSGNVYKMALSTEGLVKTMLKKVGENEKGYEEQLQKLEDRLRKHARNHCEMKLYSEHLQEQLRNEKNSKKHWESQLNFLTAQYNKQIQTLKTQLSNVAIMKTNEERPSYTARESLKPTDTLSKIKLRLMNIGNVEISEPVSCINTMRNPYPQETEKGHPQSQPTSTHNSPLNQAEKQKSVKDLKMKKSGKKDSKSKGKTIPKQQLPKEKSQSQSKLKNFKKK